MKKYYLAYGSNLNKEEMKSRCPFAIPVGTSAIQNYRLAFRGIKNISYLTIEPCEGSLVPVGIYEITPMDEANLDYYEGYPGLYDKQLVKVQFNNKEIEALVYIMANKYSYNLPTTMYISRCLQGYKDFYFSSRFLYNALEFTSDNIPKKLIK